jgi:uncharacterized protein (TIRG00374 family)
MKSSQSKWIWISLAFSVIVLIIVVFSTVDENTLNYLQQVNIWFLIAAFALRIISFALWALRIQLMAHSLGYNVSFLHCFNMVIANLLIGAITPGQVGGEPIRIHELYKAGVQIGDATAIAILERVFDAVILVVFGIVSLLIMLDLLQSLPAAVINFTILSMIMMVLAVGVLIYGLYRPVPAKKLVMQILFWFSEKIKRPLVGKFVTRIETEFDNFCKSSIAFSNTSRNGLYAGMVCSIAFWLSEFIVASVILMGLGVAPFITESFLFQIIIAIVSMIPLTPGAAGVAEISAMSLYALIDVPTSILGIFVLLWRFIMFYFNMIVGFIGSVIIFRRELHLSPKNPADVIGRVYEMQEEEIEEVEKIETELKRQEKMQ